MGKFNLKLARLHRHHAKLVKLRKEHILRGRPQFEPAAGVYNRALASYDSEMAQLRNEISYMETEK